ncbi:hypothetical protein FZI27_20305 [Cronobacter sakazakii]|nr:hypothetical protein FZI27_20305 [Cronobacter sakazakii]
MHFSVECLELFKDVARHLGEGWRVNFIVQQTPYYIYLTNPALKHFVISACRAKEGRISISGGVKDGHYMGSTQCCTVSRSRPPRQIAVDIKRKLLANAEELNNRQVERIRARSEKKEKEAILMATLSRLVVVNQSRSHNEFCSFTHKQTGVKGRIDGNVESGSFDLEVRGLNTDDLLKIIGFVTQLQPGPDGWRS